MEIQGSLAKTVWAGYRPPMMETNLLHSLPFLKMHGLGNDFVVIDSRGRDAVMTAGLAQAIGDRHRGVGFDQLAEIRDADKADFALDFWNSDGSQAAACGNATRCVCDLIMSERGLSKVRLVTARGQLSAIRRADGLVSVNMGLPQLDWADVPLARAVDMMHLPLMGDPVAVGMGNPHAIFFVSDAEAVDLAVRGPGVENDPLFPQRTNVEFVSVTGTNRMRMRVWERGAGITLACGSGVCAVTVAAHLRGLTGRSVQIDVDGGTLDVDWMDDGVWLTGPTALSFEGKLPAAFVAAHR